jgi:hypothetical protein
MIENDYRLPITQCRRGLFGSLTKGLLLLRTINTSERDMLGGLVVEDSMVSPS